MSIFELYMTRLPIKNGREKDTCLDDIGPCIQTMCTTMSSPFNAIGMVYVNVESDKKYSL